MAVKVLLLIVGATVIYLANQGPMV